MSSGGGGGELLVIWPYIKYYNALKKSLAK